MTNLRVKDKNLRSSKMQLDCSIHVCLTAFGKRSSLFFSLLSSLSGNSSRPLSLFLSSPLSPLPSLFFLLLLLFSALSLFLVLTYAFSDGSLAETSKKWGTLNVINNLFKIYFSVSIIIISSFECRCFV